MLISDKLKAELDAGANKYVKIDGATMTHYRKRSDYLNAKKTHYDGMTTQQVIDDAVVFSPLPILCDSDGLYTDITKREFMAAQVLSHIIQQRLGTQGNTIESLCSVAVEAADQLLKELSKG